MTMQWAEVAPGTVVVASGHRAWLHQLHAGGIGDPFGEPMAGEATVVSTGALLDGACAAARRTVTRVQQAPVTAVRWAWQLAWQYHTSRATPRLLAEARERFIALDDPRLADTCARQIDEETGHDELALRDLRALGYDAEAVVEACRPPTPLALIDYFALCVRSDTPVQYLGYTYALERSSMSVSRAYVEAIEAVLPRGVKATRCLRVHSALGVDAGHVAEAVRLIAELGPAERFAIARSCYETACIMNNRLPGDDPTEVELQQKLLPFKTAH